MKTYKELIIELNKFELAMKAGKIGSKALKKIGVTSNITGRTKINPVAVSYTHLTLPTTPYV